MFIALICPALLLEYVIGNLVYDVSIEYRVSNQILVSTGIELFVVSNQL